MRILDWIYDLSETSRRIEARNAYSADEICAITQQTLIRQDLANYLDRVAGVGLSDPAERLCAGLIRMSEIAHAPATTAMFHQDFGSGVLAAETSVRRPYARQYDFSEPHQRGEGRTPITLAEAVEGGCGPLDYVSVFCRSPYLVDEIVAAALTATPMSKATILILAPRPALEPWSARALASEPATACTGRLLHLDAASLHYLYLVRNDRQDLRL